MNLNITTTGRLRGVLEHGDTMRRIVLSMTFTALLVLFVWHATAARHIWAPRDVPVAFWSWRAQTPSATEVNDAVRQTGAKTLFIRAGQIDSEGGKLKRIRSVTGPIPNNIAVHFVYNSTRSLLREIEQIRVEDAGNILLNAFSDDIKRAKVDRAHVAGMQLDLDVPTRLLSHYAAILRNIRERLPHAMQLSITGLPTWLDSTELKEVLSACDFWIPQCYGAQIPERLDQRIPITSPENVARSVSRTQALGFPFYAGLSAYGYAIHYSRNGSLIGLRGDLDPLLIMSSADFELSDRTPFFLSIDDKRAAEWRCTFRALHDVVVDGTEIRAGEALLLDRPTAAGLRVCSRKVREQAGARLLGICIFRIPTAGDPTTFTLPEIVSALNDVNAKFSLAARVEQHSVEAPETHDRSIVLELANNGAVASMAGEGALTVLVRVPAGCIESVATDDSIRIETVLESENGLVRCSASRANALKLSITWWPAGERLTTRFKTKGMVLNEVGFQYAAILDDGSVMKESRTLTMDDAR